VRASFCPTQHSVVHLVDNATMLRLSLYAVDPRPARIPRRWLPRLQLSLDENPHPVDGGGFAFPSTACPRVCQYYSVRR
jgi:hypothetical protein